MNTDMLTGGNEIGALVFDLGSRSLRIGYAHDNTPKADIPAVVGVSNDGTADTVSLETDIKHDNRINTNTKYYTDITSLCVPRKGMEVVSYMRNCMVENWDLFEKILDYSYSKCLLTNSKYYPVLFVESPLNVRSKKEKLAELMFEKYNVPAIYLSKNAVLASFTSGRFTGLVVDSGATHTSAVPVYNGHVISNAIVKSPLGGDFISMRCNQFFLDKKIEVVPHYMIAQKQPVKENEQPVWIKKKTLPRVTSSWHNYMCKSVVQDFQHSVLQISEYPYEDRMASTFITSHYEFPNGYNQEFGSERFKIPDTLFNPTPIIGPSTLSMSNIVTASVGMCDVDLKPILYNNIIVTGGNSLIRGFPERLSKDLSTCLPTNIKLKVIASNVSNERRFGAWIGGSTIASAESFKQMWFSCHDYYENGKNKM